MTYSIRAHFDGQVIVPDEPVDLPVDLPLEVRLTPVSSEEGASPVSTINERRRKLARAIGCLSGPIISAESMRRENLYDE